MSYLGTALTRSSNATRCPTPGSSITTTKLSREEPDAGNLHVRDCGGRGWQHPRLPGRSNLATSRGFAPAMGAMRGVYHRAGQRAGPEAYFPLPSFRCGGGFVVPVMRLTR